MQPAACRVICRESETGNVGTYHVEYGFSTMGYDLNGALGVALAVEDDVEVYAMVGDGGYIMLNAELHTMVQENAKVNVMVFDNQGWGCIEDLQNEHGGNSYGTVFLCRADQDDEKLLGDRIIVDFAKNGESLGCKGYMCNNLEEPRQPCKMRATTSAVRPSLTSKQFPRP